MKNGHSFPAWKKKVFQNFQKKRIFSLFASTKQWMTLRLNIEIALKWHMKGIVDKIELFYPQDKNLNLTVHVGFTFYLNFFVKNITHDFEFWKFWNKILENCYLMTRESLKKHKKKFQNKNVFPFKIFFAFLAFFAMRSSSCWKFSFFSYSNQFLFGIFFGG